MLNSEKYGFPVGYSYIGKNEKGNKMEFPTEKEYEEYCEENESASEIVLWEE